MPSKPLPLTFTGQTAAGGMLSAFASDLLVIRTQTRPRGKRKPPVDLEFHVNPVGIGCLLVGSALAIWLTQNRVGAMSMPVGHWAFASTSGGPERSFAQVLESKRGAAPVRRVINEYGQDVGYEAASWISDGNKTVRGIVQRQGFLNNGEGTLITDTYEDMPGLVQVLTGGGWVPLAKLMGL